MRRSRHRHLNLRRHQAPRSRRRWAITVAARCESRTVFSRRHPPRKIEKTSVMQRLWVVPLAVMVIVMGPRSLASQKNPIQSSRILRTRTLNRRRSPRSATASVVTFSKLNSSMGPVYRYLDVSPAVLRADLRRFEGAILRQEYQGQLSLVACPDAPKRTARELTPRSFVS